MREDCAPKGPAYRVETERLRLRCWRPDDAPALVEVLSDGRAAHFERFIPFLAMPRDVPGWAAVLRLWRAEHDLDKHFRFPMFRSDDGTLVGEVMLLDREAKGERELGVWLDPRHVGLGYAAEGARAMARLAFEVDGVPQVDVGCERENTRAKAAAERLGYVRTGSRTVGEGVELDLFRLLAEGHAAEHPAPIRAFNCLGERLL